MKKSSQNIPMNKYPLSETNSVVAQHSCANGRGILNILTALACEARPLIDFYHLKKLSVQHAFDIFSNKEQNMHLIISGIGRIKVATATSYLHVLTGMHEHTTYLNVGIAGSQQYQIGECVLANKIIDSNTGISFYPSTFYLNNFVQNSLITFDKPQHQYPESGMIDMEASGFWQSASMLITQEQIQILKIIADNSFESQQNITREIVSKLINDKISEIDSVIQKLLKLSAQEKTQQVDLRVIDKFTAKWHFTTYQVNQLRELTRRWNVMREHQDPFQYCCERVGSAKAVLLKLEEGLECTEFL